MSVLSRTEKIIAAALSGAVGVLLLGCNMSAIDPMQGDPQGYQPVKTLIPVIVTATYFTPTITLSPTSTSTPTATDVPPTLTPTATRTLTPSATPTPTATRRRPTPTVVNDIVPISAELPTQVPDDGSPTQVPEPSATPPATPSVAPPSTEDPSRVPILTMGACNAAERGYIWGEPNVAARNGFESRTLMMTEWAPMECWPDTNNPIRPPRQLTVAECAVYYFKPVILVLFPTRPFDGRPYYDDVASLILHINSYEDEIGLPRSKKIVIGPVSYEGGGVIGSPNAVLVLGAGVVNLPDIIVKTRDVTGFMAASDNVHLVPSTYFYGIVNTVVQKAIAGTNTVYTIETGEIPPYPP